MKPIESAAVFAILAFAALPLAAQTPLPDAGPIALSEPPSGQTSAAASATPSDREAATDPRRCLEFATNPEIIRCVEKNWPYKRKKRS